MHSYPNTLAAAASNSTVAMAVLKRPPQPVIEVNSLSIPELIFEITRKSDNADDQTIHSAMMLRQLRLRVQRGELGPNVNWYEYALHAVKLRRSRLKELDRIANAKDPRHELDRLRHLAVERAKNHKAKSAKDETLTEKQMRDKVARFAKKGPVEQVRELARLAEPMPPRDKVKLFAKEGPIAQLRILYRMVHDMPKLN